MIEIRSIFLMMKTALFLLMLTVISFPSLSALSLQAPASAEVETNFTVSIISSLSTTHDVKIFVKDEHNKTLTQIVSDGTWKSSFYYIHQAFPRQKSFTLKALSPASNASLCVRLRLSGASTYEEHCMPFQAIPARLPAKSSTILSSPPPSSGSKTIVTKEYYVERFLIYSVLSLTPLVLLFLLVKLIRNI